MASDDFLGDEEKERLLRSLHNMTENQTLSWQDPSAHDANFGRKDTFEAELENFQFIIYSVDSDGVPPYELDVYRYEGDEVNEKEIGIEIAAIQTIPRDNLETPFQGRINALLGNLYNEVSHAVRRPDEAIRDLFEMINRRDPQPPF